MSVKNEIEYRKLSLVAPQISKGTDSNYEVYGYATTFEPYVLLERDGLKIYEQIDRNAFQNADMSDVIMQYDHTGRVLARQSNGSLKLNIDERGLYITADLSGSTAARELFEDIKAGLVNKMSWAFIVGHQEYDKKSRTRFIKSIKKVFEVGAVSIPANDNTLIGARSFLSNEIEIEHQELLQRKKQVLRMKHMLLTEGIL